MNYLTNGISKKVLYFSIGLFMMACEKRPDRGHNNFYFHNTSSEVVYLTTSFHTPVSDKFIRLNREKVGKKKKVYFSWSDLENEFGGFSFPPAISKIKIENDKGEFFEEECIHQNDNVFDTDYCNLSVHSILDPNSYERTNRNYKRNSFGDFHYYFTDENLKKLK